MRMLSFALLTLTCGAQSLAAAQAQSQGLPTSQPSLIAIIREDVQTNRRYDNDAAMTAELDRFSRADAEVLNSIRTIRAIARVRQP